MPSCFQVFFGQNEDSLAEKLVPCEISQHQIPRSRHKPAKQQQQSASWELHSFKRNGEGQNRLFIRPSLEFSLTFIRIFKPFFKQHDPFSNEILYGVPVYKTDENIASLTDTGENSVSPQGSNFALFPPPLPSGSLGGPSERPTGHSLRTTGYIIISV